MLNSFQLNAAACKSFALVTVCLVLATKGLAAWQVNDSVFDSGESSNASTETSGSEYLITDHAIAEPDIIRPNRQDPEVAPPPPSQRTGAGEDQRQATASEQAEARQKAADALAQKVASAYQPVFYNNDFSYILDPNYQDWHLGESLKQLCLPRGGRIDIGGQYRARAHFEQNMRGLGLTGVDDQFLLHRTRIFANAQLDPDIRVYAELLDAESNYEDFGPRPIEVNRVDMQNLFVDAHLFTNHWGEWSARVGRQELLFGAQRVISPLDWANTRRTFEGVRLTLKNDKTSVDGFWVNPMRIDDHSFDAPDRDQEFMGLYSTRQVSENQTVDTYFVRHLNGRGANNFEYNTLGVRVKGGRCGLLWDFESGYQFGENSDGSDHAAGTATFGLGHEFSSAPSKPTIWFYYDWASGDNDLGAGNGYHHGFPLAHKYLGFMDFFGRRNIEDFNVLYTVQPGERLKLLAWYHYMFLSTQSDAPYSVVMTPFNGGNAPGDPELGHEIDLIADYKIGPRQNLILGYSHFFDGDYYSTTAGVPFTGDANFWYTQWTVNF